MVGTRASLPFAHLILSPLPPDSLDTPQAMRVMKELVTTSNIYLSDQSSSPNARLLQNVGQSPWQPYTWEAWYSPSLPLLLPPSSHPAKYLTGMLRVFGVVPQDSTLGFPVVQTAVADEVRNFRVGT